MKRLQHNYLHTLTQCVNKVKGQRSKRKATVNLSHFSFHISPIYAKKDILLKMSFSIKVAMPTRGSVGCDTNAKQALVATKGGLSPPRSVLKHQALASQRSAFRPLLSHKPACRFDNSCSERSRAVWQSHTAWVAISRDCQI